MIPLRTPQAALPHVSRRGWTTRRAGGLGLAVLVIGLLWLPPASAADIVLKETGSSLLYPLFKLWITAYATAQPGVTIDAAGTNSGEGVRSAITGTVQIGASDAYMADEDAMHNPQIVSIPLAISAQTINYNIPDLNAGELRLDGRLLAEIYSGRIRQWNAAEIAALNPGVKLPDHDIIVVRRADASGDSFMFTQFLDFSVQQWEDDVGYGTTVNWPSVPGELTANGNDGMKQVIAATPYSVGYIGISFSRDIKKAGLGTAVLKNQAGKFVLPTAETISAAASALDQRTPADERLSLVDAPGEQSYPLVNYEYAMVSIRQPQPATAAAIRNFLLWSIAIVDGGNAPKFLDAVGFIPLPDFIRAMSEKQIGRIK